ncbi:hypothetical protein QBC46DRAFT_244207, partial [Diplogelasinospora grovesii]
ERVLVIIPTENAAKQRILMKAFKGHKPGHVVELEFRTLSADSEVGEQPYNLEAGMQGAHNRISNAQRKLLDPNAKVHYDSLNKDVAFIFASIENYIQVDGVERPTDFGLVVMHNMSTNKTTAAISRGVTVPRAYVNRARLAGHEHENPDHGKVTVGQVLAANLPGLDKADWHKVLAGTSRYDLLKEAIDGME